MKKDRARSGASHTGDAETREWIRERWMLERPHVLLFGNGESASRLNLSEFQATTRSFACMGLSSRLSKEAPEDLSSMIGVCLYMSSWEYVGGEVRAVSYM